MRLTVSIFAMVVSIAAGGAFAAQLPNSYDASPPLLRAQSADPCPEQYGSCVDSCSRQQSQCADRGSTGAYCASASRSCANACERSMRVCSNADRRAK